MTIPNQIRRTDSTGNDTTPTYPYTFRIKDAADIAVYYLPLGGVEVPLLATDYTVNGPFDQDSGGTYTITNATYLNGSGNLETGDILVVIGNRVDDQTVSFKNQAKYLPAKHEKAFDNDTIISQQLKEELARTLRMNVTDQTTPPKVVGPFVNGDRMTYDSASDSFVGTPDASGVGTPTTTVTGHVPVWADNTGDGLGNSGIPASDITANTAAAGAAQADATQALSDAAAAQGTANTAASDATQALSDAAAAQGTANTADGKANTNTSLLAGVQLETVGPVTDFLDRSGNYSVPSGSGSGIGAPVASAAALPLLNDGRFNLVTGSVGITSMNSVGVGKIKTLEFAATCLVASNANIILNSGDDVVVSAGDKLTFYEFASGQWKLINYLSYTTNTMIATASNVNITAAALVTVTTLFDGEPKNWAGFIGCRIAEHGYAIADRVPVNLLNNSDAATTRVNTAYFDTLTFNLRYTNAASAFLISNKATGVAAAITNANWGLYLKVWR